MSKTIKCGSCGAPIPKDTTECNYCGAVTKPEKEKVYVIYRDKPRKRYHPGITIPKEKKDNNGYFGAVAFGLLLAIAAYFLVYKDPDNNKILLLLMGPASIIFMIAGLSKVYPRFRGIFLILFGIVWGGGAFWFFDFLFGKARNLGIFYVIIGALIFFSGWGVLLKKEDQRPTEEKNEE
jgi:CDP-diglyceride synthetase